MTIADQSESSNPLLEGSRYVDYSRIEARHIVPAVEQVIQEARGALERILSQVERARTDTRGLSFETVLFALIEIDLKVSRVWGPIGNLLSVKGTPEIRQAADQARPLVIDFSNDLALDPRVYELVSIYAETAEGKGLTEERARYLSNTLRDLRLAGAALPEDKKNELRTLNQRLAELGRRFSDNATDSKFEMVLTTPEELAGLPDDIIAAARRRGDSYREKLGEEKIPAGACVFNLDYPSYIPFIRYSERGDLRKKIAWEYMQQGTGHATRGLLDNGEKGTGSLDNQPILREICSIRARRAELLGFKNHAELGLTTKMARNPETVRSFLESLMPQVQPIARKEYQALVDFQNQIQYCNTENRPDRVFPWDREFLAEKLRKARYDIDSSQVKPYFELRATLAGMFSIAGTLFGITFEKLTSVPVWHPDVEVYQVRNEAGKPCGTLYMDLFPRDEKSSGAWVNPLSNNCWDIKGEPHEAQCVLVCNMTQPAPDAPSLLSFEEVTTLFHECGHALHQLLSTVELEPLSGLNVAYDFVELPSQLFENFCNEEISLRTFAKHYQTGDIIPDDLLQKIMKAKKFLAGILFLRQLAFGLLDITIYTLPDASQVDADQIYRDIITRYDVFEYWEGTHFPCSFSHIFGGGYSAGYYSYKWSEALEADAFSRFKEDGVLSARVGRQYRDKILSRGDAEEPMALFVDFMGREPRPEAILERLDR